jgi:hypothetical protein
VKWWKKKDIEMPELKVPDIWTPEQIAELQKQLDEIPSSHSRLKFISSDQVDPVDYISTVMRIVDDWEQDYFTTESWPPHTKAHISQALNQLRNRIKGLVQ